MFQGRVFGDNFKTKCQAVGHHRRQFADSQIQRLDLRVFQIRGQRMQAYFENAGESIAFIGHTHEPECIIWDGWNIKQEVLQRGIISLNPKCKYIINAGSVGQPRDDNNRAKYLIWDEARESLELRHVAYPVDVVIAKMAAKNYPAQYAERLR